MKQEVISEILDEIISAFEGIEAQSAGILTYLKAQGIVTDAQLKPYLEEASKASSVRWRAAKARIEHLLAAAVKDSPPSFTPNTESSSTVEGPSQENHPEQKPHKQPKLSEQREKPVEGAAEAASRQDAEIKDQSNARKDVA